MDRYDTDARTTKKLYQEQEDLQNVRKTYIKICTRIPTMEDMLTSVLKTGQLSNSGGSNGTKYTPEMTKELKRMLRNARMLKKRLEKRYKNI